MELHDHYMSNEDFCGKFYDKEGKRRNITKVLIFAKTISLRIAAFKKPNTSLTSPYLRKPESSELEIAHTFSLKGTT